MVRHAGVVVVDTTDVVRVLESSHPPTCHLSRTAFTDGRLPVGRTTFRERNGTANYVDVVVRAVDWRPSPDRDYPELSDRVAACAGPFDEVTLDGEAVTPQPGGFYDGRITADVVGPFEGGPGSRGW